MHIVSMVPPKPQQKTAHAIILQGPPDPPSLNPAGEKEKQRKSKTAEEEESRGIGSHSLTMLGIAYQLMWSLGRGPGGCSRPLLVPE